MDSLKKYHIEFIKNNQLILKTQQRFKSERYNVFTEEINRILLISNDDKRMQSIDLMKTCIWNKQRLASEKEKNKFNNIIKWWKND